MSGRSAVQSLGADMAGHPLAVWRLAFKPKMDDMRDASSPVLVHESIGRRAPATLFDPASMNVELRVLPPNFTEAAAIARNEFADVKYYKISRYHQDLLPNDINMKIGINVVLITHKGVCQASCCSQYCAIDLGAMRHWMSDHDQNT